MNPSRIVCAVLIITSAFALSIRAQPFLTNGLVAYYPFNGNANDASGNGNNGTINGATLTQDRSGNANSAYSFNGINNNISFASPPLTQTDNWTMTAWLQPASLNQDGIAVAMGYDTGSFSYGGNGYAFGMQGPNGYPSFVTPGNQLLGAFTFIEGFYGGFTFTSTNQWYQVVMMRSAGVTTFYVNGVGTPDGATSTPLTPTAFTIGSENGLRYFNGAIDDVRIYNRALSTNEVAELYAVESAAGPPAGIVSWWAADGNTIDQVGGNNGVPVGAVGYTNGEVGQAFSFDGNGSGVQVGSATNLQLQDFTIETWLKRASTSVVSYGSGGNATIFGYGTGAYNFFITMYGVLIFSQQGNINSVAGPTITDTNWHHVAVTKVGSTIVFYLDGVAYTTQPYNVTLAFTGGPPGIGFWGETHDNAFLGALDELSFYNRALASNEIAAIYNAGSGGKYFPPVPPSITIQPQPVIAYAGDNVSFNVTVSGTTPLSYQWSINGTNILGATSNSLTISNIAQTDLGAYAVLVGNPFGSTNSTAALLSMYPFVETPFVGAITYWGKDTTLSLEGWGTGPLHYQWFKDGVAVFNATNQTLFLPAIQFTNAGLYSVVLSSSLGSVTNTPAQVVVNPAGVSIGMLPGVYVSGVVGYTYTIQANSDLTNTNGWTTTATLTLLQPVQLWVDTTVNALSPANPHKYYRVLPGG